MATARTLCLVLLAVLAAHPRTAMASDTAAEALAWDLPGYLVLSPGTTLSGGSDRGGWNVPLTTRLAGYWGVRPGLDLGLFVEHRVHLSPATTGAPLHEVLTGASLRLGPARRGWWAAFGVDAGAVVYRSSYATSGERRWFDGVSFYTAIGLVVQAPGHRFANGLHLGFEGTAGGEFVAGGTSAQHGSDYRGEGLILVGGFFVRLGLLFGVP